MAIQFLTDVDVPNKILYVDTINDKVGIGSSAGPGGPQALLHVEKGGLTPSFTAPNSEVIRVQSKEASELSGTPPASDINIFTAQNGYARVVFTDDTIAYGENGVVMDFAAAPPTLNLRTKANNTLICDYYASVSCGVNHTITSATATFAANDGNNPSGEKSFAAGHLTEATGDISAAFGYDTLASGGASFSIGALTTASGGNSFASGGGSTASGGESAAFGYQTVASGEESFAIGNQTTASGASSFAGGGPTTLASAPNAFAFGADVDVTGGHSAGFGRLHDIAGTENLVGGFEHTVNGAANLVGGATNDLASNEGMVVGGGNNTCPGSAHWSLLVGQNNQVSGAGWSFTGGKECQNFSDFGIAFGSGATASNGLNQFSFGEGTTTPNNGTSANATGQFAVGRFNVYSTSGIAHMFAVGTGTSDFARSTAFCVTSTSKVGVAGITNPTEALHVNGSVKATATTDAYKGYIKSVVNSTPLMKSANTNYNYLPFNTTIFGSTADYYNRITVPYNGRIKKITLRHIPDASGTVPTATGLKFKFEKNGSVIATEYTATVIGGASANFLATYNFGNSDLTFTQGDYIGILVQTSGGTGSIIGASAQIVFEYNIT